MTVKSVSESAAAAEAAPATAPGAAASVTTPEGCTIQRFTVHSKSMDREINAIIMLPPQYEAQKEARFPVLYALHGMDAPYAVYTDMTPLRASLRDHPMIVVSFDGDKRGWYIDATKKKDSQFTTFFFEELIPYIDGHFRTRADVGSRGVTGFSMGGYGAFHYMLTHPDRIGSVSALSGAFTFAKADNPKRLETITPLLGNYAENKAEYEKNELYPRFEELIDKGTAIPPMFIHCGTEDGIVASGRGLLAFVLEQNKKLHEAKKTPLNFQYRESSGEHKFPFWRDGSVGIADFHWRIFQESAKKLSAENGKE